MTDQLTDQNPLVDQQLEILKRRLQADPGQFRDVFISEGMQAVARQFTQPDLSPEFTVTLWDSLRRADDASRILMRFIWSLPLGMKRKFIRALDAHLSERYPMFTGLSVDWPAGNAIPPYIREPGERDHDF